MELEPAEPVDQKVLEEELAELRGAADLAKTIRDNAKARALIAGLGHAFAETVVSPTCWRPTAMARRSS